MKKIILEDNEKEVISAAYETLRKNFKRPKASPSTIKEEKEEVLEEGLKFFKASTRLYKLSKKLEKKAEGSEYVLELANKINKLGEKFEYAEAMYDVGRKQEAKMLEKELINKYNDILKLTKKEETKNALRKVNSLALVMASMTVPYIALNKFFPTLSFGAVNTAALSDGTVMGQIKLYLKRAGAFSLCGAPVKAAKTTSNKIEKNSDEKMLKTVDKLLN